MCGSSVCGMPRSVKDRKWIDVKASSNEEECIVQVELSRKSLDTGRVRNKLLAGYWVVVAGKRYAMSCNSKLLVKSGRLLPTGLQGKKINPVYIYS